MQDPQNFRFSGVDNIQLHCSYCLLDADLKSVIQISHGMAGHGVAIKLRSFIRKLNAGTLNAEARIATSAMVEKLILKPCGDADLHLNPWAIIEKRSYISDELN